MAERGPLERLLDVAVYAPLGLVMTLDEVLPQLVERGHQQVSMARMFGQFAVQTGGKEARKRLEKVSAQVTELVAGAIAPPAPASPPAAPAAAPRPVPERPLQSVPDPVVDEGPVPDAGGLGIPDYDLLSASQVVPRLAGLASDDLEAVRRYESGHRGRKTILARIAQLQA
ncbi:MAG TPA: hypothetical protein VFG94_14150 [Acidimicrobiales bacterium]|nr:hypothetical protein [Acidimicrobiales bacterium]